MDMPRYTQLRQAKRPSLECLLPLSFPLSLYVETINRCMFRCTYCPMSLDSYEKEAGGFRTMSLAEFQKIASDIQAGGPLKVLRFYFMGEPLLNPDLPEMIALAGRMQLAERTELTTNAVLLGDKLSTSMIRAGLDYLRISISSVDQRRHERVTRTNVKIKKIYDNVRRFKEIRRDMGATKPFLYVKLLDPQNAEERSAFLNMYEHVADEAVIEEPMNWDSYGDHDFMGALYGGQRDMDESRLRPHPKEVCPFPFYSLAITANGDVTVCCVDWNKATKVGNVFESSLQDIWNGESLRQFRRMHIERQRHHNPSCKNCSFLYTAPDNLDRMSPATITKILEKT
ncbi:MAG TPA: radical SAM/SPASM domain-containing protein [Smithellaceae bacterium]|nr:radical SAM/SPASM domain-containing protein [Smithellaceae bacterium]